MFFYQSGYYETKDGIQPILYVVLPQQTDDSPIMLRGYNTVTEQWVTIEDSQLVPKPEEEVA